MWYVAVVYFMCGHCHVGVHTKWMLFVQVIVQPDCAYFCIGHVNVIGVLKQH